MGKLVERILTEVVWFRRNCTFRAKSEPQVNPGNEKCGDVTCKLALRLQ